MQEAVSNALMALHGLLLGEHCSRKRLLIMPSHRLTWPPCFYHLSSFISLIYMTSPNEVWKQSPFEYKWNYLTCFSSWTQKVGLIKFKIAVQNCNSRTTHLTQMLQFLQKNKKNRFPQPAHWKWTGHIHSLWLVEAKALATLHLFLT